MTLAGSESTSPRSIYVQTALPLSIVHVLVLSLQSLVLPSSISASLLLRAHASAWLTIRRVARASGLNVPPSPPSNTKDPHCLLYARSKLSSSALHPPTIPMPIMGPQIPLKRPGSAFEGSTSEYAISLEDYDDLAPMRPTKIPRTPIGRSEVHQPEWSQGINYSVSPMAIHDLGADLSFGAHDSEPLHPPRAHAQSTATFGCQSVSVPSQLEEQDMVFTDEDIKQLLDEINEEAEKLSERPAQKFSTLQPAHSSEIIDLTDDADDVIDLTGETIGHNRSVVRSTTALSHQPGNKYNSHYGYDQYNAVWPSPGRHAQVNRALFSTPDVMHVSPSQHQDRAQQLRTTAFWRGVQPQYPIPSGIAQYPMRPPPPVITIQDGPDFAEMAEQSRIIDRKEKGGVLNKIGVGDEALLEQMPKAKQPKRIKTEMLPYQLQVSCFPYYPIGYQNERVSMFME